MNTPIKVVRATDIKPGSGPVEKARREIKVGPKNMTLPWGGYHYRVELGRIVTERDLLVWSLHLCGKTWMNIARLRAFIETIAELKGFDLYSQ